MRTFKKNHISQIKSFNEKIIPHLPEYYFLEDLIELGKINLRIIFTNKSIAIF